MAKFSGASAVKKAQEGQLGGVELPTEGEQVVQQQPVEEAPASPPPSALLQALNAAQPVEQDVVGATEEAVAPIAEEVERQSIPSLTERGRDFQRVDRWLKTPKVNTGKASGDGGLRDRARAMAANVASGNLGLVLTTRGTTAFPAARAGEIAGPEITERVAQENEASLFAAIGKADGIQEYDPQSGRATVDPVYTQVASAVVENEFANVLLGTGPVELPEFTQEEAEAGLGDLTGTGEGGGVLTHSAGNAKLGQAIHQEYQRMKGVKVPEKLERKEAETVGAAYKHLWAESNPDMVTRTQDPETNQYVYQLTADGENALKDGEADRKRLFPKINVRPAKQPLPTGQLPGDVGQNIAKKVSGKVGDQKFGKTIEQAMTNMAQVANVVDKQRAKILMATILPVLRDGSHETWQAEINNIGPSKVQKFKAAKAEQDKRFELDPSLRDQEEVYSPEENLAALVDKVAQEVRAVSQERNGANYLTYNVQGFQGRITPQQSFFNPTTSKAVRFVTRSATPATATPGSRVEKNLRQMYAMMLLPKNLKADVDLPVVREQKLYANEAKLEGWGDRLEAALAMTDEQYEAVSQAIEAGMALTDPNFPQFGGLELDPEADAELIKHIESKGEDGPHVIDGLMDFAKYAKAKRAKRPHRSYFNAYMDGKTNGLASNGIQMGHITTAERTGVLRSSRETLLDDGDIRDELQNIAVNSLVSGFGGADSEFSSQLTEVAQAVFTHRDLNKITTMTFGYGKEIETFSANIEETMALMSEKLPQGHPYHQALAELDAWQSRKELADTLLNQKYAPALASVMSEDALATRAVMRGAAALHSATNQLFSIKGPTGMDINLGRDVTTGYEGAEITSYDIERDGEKQKSYVGHYETESTSAAERRIGEELKAGEYAYGGSVVAPVQAMDAATVALTASGKSWDRLSKASGNNPYLHTIYDAFKVDANGYDVVLEEVNKNWLNTGMKWSYLEEAHRSTKEAMMKWTEKMKDRPKNEKLSVNEAKYMQFMLKPSISERTGKPFHKNLTLKTAKMMDIEPFSDQSNNVVKDFSKAMRSVGYDIYNPPTEPTVAQLDVFVRTLAKHLNLRSRMDAAIERTNEKKRELKNELLKRGYKTPSGERIALQYYAH